jgi:twitching motility two-component system response regulator PilH
MKILVVEDSPNEMKLIGEALAAAGHEILTATDGEEALRQAFAHRPDVVVLDILLPKRNGYQVARELKQTAATKGVRIVMLSSKSQESDRFWGLKQGADDYMTKPFHAHELVARVERHV